MMALIEQGLAPEDFASTAARAVGACGGLSLREQAARLAGDGLLGVSAPPLDVTAPALSMVQGSDRQIAETIIKGSLAKSIRVIMLVSAVLALAGAASGALLPGSRRRSL